MTDNKFRHLSDHLLLAISMVEKMKSGEKDIEKSDTKRFLAFEVGMALIEVFELTKENPKGTLKWIRKMLEEDSDE